MSFSSPPEPRDSNRQFAALDLGSNSFHMVVAQEGENRLLTVVDRLKESVRLGAGLNEDGQLDPEVQERALACLRNFGERVAGLPRNQVRAVGTNTLRKTKDALDFLQRAEDALGHPIEVISGREEARLIFRGVIRDVDAPGRMLVIDIGGGSTELIIGEASEPTRLDSLYMGCVSFSRRFFPDGEISREGMEAAITAARRQLQSVVRAYRKSGWDEAVGSSGTINAIERILQSRGHAAIDPAGLEWLRNRLIKTGFSDDLALDGLSESRRPVIAGGVAVLSALFMGLRIESLRATPNALREGVLLELIGRDKEADIRDQTVRHLVERFEIDARQAFRVQQTALSLFDQARTDWGLEDHHRRLLKWAASLHESGLFLTYSGYHKHSAYLLTHMEMPGFSRQDQRCIAAIIRGHRGKPSREKIAEFAPMWDRKLLHLVVLLRLSTKIHRRRSPRPPPSVSLETQGRTLFLSFPGNWIETRPLSLADLEEDATQLLNLNYKLRIR